MKVVHLINSLDLGGAERFLHDLVLELDQTLVSAHVVCLFREGELAQSLKEKGIPVLVLGINPKMTLGGWISVWKAIRGLKPDVVHAHLPEAAWYGLVGARLAGVGARFVHIQNTNRHWSKKIKTLDRVASYFATRAFACSNAVKQFVVEIGYSPYKVEVLFNWVDLKRFRYPRRQSTARNTLRLADDELIALCVASLTPQKGHQHLLLAWENVIAAFPKSKLLLVGEGSLDDNLKKQVDDLGLSSHVQFMGSRMDIPVLLEAADVFVLASLWEGLGLVLAEAGAAGVPVVATNVGGVPEIVKDGSTGILVEPAVPGQLAQAVLTLLRDDELREQMGVAGRAHVEKHASISAIARRLEAHYQSATRPVKRGPGLPER